MASKTVLTSAQRTATTVSETIAWQQPKAYLVVDVSAIAATPSITPHVQILDPVSGAWFTIWTAAAAITATGTKVYCLTDTAFAPSGLTETKQLYLTDTIRVGFTHADADAITYSAALVEVNSRFPAVL